MGNLKGYKGFLLFRFLERYIKDLKYTNYNTFIILSIFTILPVLVCHLVLFTSLIVLLHFLQYFCYCSA